MKSTHMHIVLIFGIIYQITVSSPFNLSGFQYTYITIWCQTEDKVTPSQGHKPYTAQSNTIDFFSYDSFVLPVVNNGFSFFINFLFTYHKKNFLNIVTDSSDPQ